MNTPKLYRKKPVEVEAMQWDGTAEGAGPIIDWITQNGQLSAQYVDAPPSENGRLYIDAIEGRERVMPNAWVIRGVQSEFYPCIDNVFRATYEVVTGG